MRDVAGAAQRLRVAARRGAGLFVLAAVLVLVWTSMGLVSDTSAGYMIVVAALGAAVVLGVLPWQRWSRWSLLVVAVTTAFTLVGVAYATGAMTPYVYPMWFLFAFVWIGASYPPWTSVALAPVTALAYVGPMLALGERGDLLASAVIAVPASIMVGELVARAMTAVHTARADSAHREDLIAAARLGERALVAPDLQTLLDDTVELVAHRLDVPLVGIVAFDERRERLTLRAGRGWRRGLIGQHDLPADGLPGAACANEPFPEWIAEHHAVVSAGASIRTRDGVWGALTVHVPDDRQFDDDAGALLRAVANVLGAAVERERADAEIHEQRAQLAETLETYEMALEVAQAEVWEFALETGGITIFGTTDPLGASLEGSWLSHVIDEDQEIVEEGFAAVLRDGVGSCEVRAHGGSGDVHWKRSFGRLNEAERKIIGVTVDVTESKAAERALRDGHKLKAVGELAAGVAHELNNLLTAIIGHAEALERQAVGVSPPPEIDRILQSTARGRDLAAHLLAFGSGQPVRAQDLDLVAAVATTSPLLSRLVGDGVELATDLPAEPIMVHIDPSQLQQVHFALLLHAGEGLAAGGRINVVVDRIDDASGGWARWRVRASASREGAVGDFGDVGDFGEVSDPRSAGQRFWFSLLTAADIVHEAGGQLRVAGDDASSAVEVLFPRVASSRVPVTETQPGGGRVLVVDDEPAIRELLAVALRNDGHDVLVAADGREAVDLAATSTAPIDLLVADVVMPHLRGPDAARLIREQVPSMKVLFVSGYTGGDELGGEAFLQKPFRMQDLLHSVRDLLDA